MIRTNEALEGDGSGVSRSLEGALLTDQWRADSSNVCSSVRRKGRMMIIW